MTQRIGMVGIGLMGHGIASNLVRHGHALTVLDHPGNQPLDALKAAGAQVAATLQGVAAAADVIILCVTGSPQVEAIVLGDDGLLKHLRPGTVIVDCSTAVPVHRARGRRGAGCRRPLPRHADDAHAEGGSRRPAQSAGGR